MQNNRFRRFPAARPVDDPWILQRFLPGVPCSVGFVGGRSAQPSFILPPAQQDIRLEDGQFRYEGGQIPCAPELAAAVAEVAQRLAEQLGLFSGYVGADLVVTRSSQGPPVAQVIEINPRFCTSYVGYRSLAKDNLAAVMLGQLSGDACRWNCGTLRFDTTGRVELTGRDS